MSEFEAFRNEFTPKIDTYLKEHLKHEVTDPNISQIMSYSVMAGGKRLRPLLFLATLKTLAEPIDEKRLRIACGIELIHTYSLIHDDLPAMDNDDYRRGQLTSHKKWGEAEAILAGDALLPLGIQWLADSSNKTELVRLMAKAVGPNGMVGGQYLDIDSTNNPSRAQDGAFINKMEWLKTGCLIQASVEMATVVASTRDEVRQHLVSFARHFGRAYQIYDDLVDIVETAEQAGKATHKDEAEGKNNTLTFLGAQTSREKLTQLIQSAQSDLKPLHSNLLAGFLGLYQKVL